MEKLLSFGWVPLLTLGGALIGVIILLVLLFKRLRRNAVEKIVYTRTFSEEGVYEGGEVTFYETIYNPTYLPLFFIDVEQYFYNGIPLADVEFDRRKAMQYFLSRFHLWPKMQIRRRHTVRCLRRGFYQLETAGIYGGKEVRYVDAPASLYVYPRIIDPGERTHPSSTRQGETVSQRRLFSDPFSLSGIRDYQNGDAFSLINFKATARTGQLKVNQRDFCSGRVLMVYLNLQVDPDESIPTPRYERMIENGLSISSALVREASEAGYRAGFGSNCQMLDGRTQTRFPVGAGQQHLVAILKEMAMIRPQVGGSFQSLLDEDLIGGMTETEITILTPYISDVLSSQVAQFQEKGNDVKVIVLKEGDI